MIDPGGDQTLITYSPRGLAAEIETTADSVTSTETRTYDAAGTMTGVDLSDGANEIGVELSWDTAQAVPQVIESTNVFGEFDRAPEPDLDTETGCDELGRQRDQRPTL